MSACEAIKHAPELDGDDLRELEDLFMSGLSSPMQLIVQTTGDACKQIFETSKGLHCSATIEKALSKVPESRQPSLARAPETSVADVSLERSSGSQRLVP